MVFHKARYEKVAVIVTGLAAQLQVMTGLARGLFEHLRVKLIGEELVGGALVDENRAVDCVAAQELAGVPVSPSLPIGAQIGGEDLDAPRAAHRRGNRRKGR